MEEIELGCKAEDKVTGLKGIVIARAKYLNGCIQCCLKPRITAVKTTYPEGEWIDEIQLKVIGRGVLPPLKPEAKKRKGKRKPAKRKKKFPTFKGNNGPQRDAPRI